MNLNDQAAVVTGAASGLGAATARALAAAGAKVALLDLNEDALAQIAAVTGGYALGCDVADAASAEGAVAAARERHGVARVLVNCAGIAPAKRIVGRGGPMPLDEFAAVITVNLIGTFNLLRLVAADLYAVDPVSADGERGVIINTASVAAYDGQIGQAAYSASKGGVVALTLTAARDLSSQGIRVMTIAPGLIATPMLSGMSAAVQESLATQVPFPQRLGRPGEYADLVLHIIANPLL
ncbi:MAG: SDR family NAD(P)-dependent oxidoreductase, partial [Gammaproteobacteria bacterium]|nr:SDR family NAD(P)-dependent oxidoreductase [Gammaproteobacteria bacterium]